MPQRPDNFPPLACPDCDRPAPAKSVNADESVTYTCAAKNHAATHGLPVTWRITKDGAFLEKSAAGQFE